MANMDVFNQNAFSMVEMTDFINKKPHIPAMVRDMNIFEPEPVRTTTVWVEFKDGKIALIPTSQRGEPLFQNKKQKRRAVPLKCLRIAKGDRVTSHEIQDIRAEGEEAELKEVMTEVNMRLEQMDGDADLTMENLMLGALQGILVDADGASVIYNFYTEFGVSQPAEIDFDLDNASPAAGALQTKCNQIVRAIQKAGQGAYLPTTTIRAFVGDTFWDKFTTHSEVKGAYNNWIAAQNLSQATTPYAVFRWGGIDWVNYRGTDNNSTVAIPTDKAKFFPVGARGVFKVAYAPAEFTPFVNTRGQERYAMVVPDPTVRQAYVDVEVYKYPLPYCTRPEMLQRGTA
jgi:hypothetical protein